jgi:hypothetical protein
VPWLKRLSDSSIIWSSLFTGIAGLLPVSLSAIFNILLPYIMRRIGKYTGALTRGQLDKDVIKNLFVFVIVRFRSIGHVSLNES